MVRLFDEPVSYCHETRFVLTEDRVYFTSYRREFDWPHVRDILGEIFNLDDPEVCGEVEGIFSDGKIIVGSYYPSTEGIVIEVPLETSGYVRRRIEEVFGGA
jgi:hypothetical protein